MSVQGTTEMDLSKEIQGQFAVPKNWENRQVTFTGDDVIDAYYKGRDDGKNAFAKAIRNQLNTNVGLAAKLAVQLFTESKKLRIDLKGIYLKVDTINQFSVLFIADKETFVSEEFLQVYSIARNLRQESENDDLYMNFSFVPDTGSMNDDLLSSDGYYLKYKHGKQH